MSKHRASIFDLKAITIEAILLFSVLFGAIVFILYTTITLVHQEPSVAKNIHSIKLPSNSLKLHHSASDYYGPQTGIHSLPKSVKLPQSILSTEEIKSNLTSFLNTLHHRLSLLADPEVQVEAIWNTFINLSKKTTLKWEIEYKKHRPTPRHDHSIFVSIASFRDPFCAMTLESLYGMAKNPETLHVAVIQQNCFEDKCTTSTSESEGIDELSKYKEGNKDPDCYQEFCETHSAKKSNACQSGRLQVLNVNETEGLGPYMARYIASKLYRGEHYYLQIDSHSEFVTNWDEKLIRMIERAPALKPIISSYPPGPHEAWMDTVGLRMCDSYFAEGDIIRLSSATTYESKIPYRPRYTPFLAAGFLFTTANFLYEVPFDPLLPWVFMGEEIAMSSRAWTSGFDFFSPSSNILNHYYVRPNKPKYWETVDRFLKRPDVFTELNLFVLWRLKYLLQYPEARSGVSKNEIPPSVKFGIENYTLGIERPFQEYTTMVGIDFKNKSVTENTWCYEGLWPKLAKKYKRKKKA